MQSVLSTRFNLCVALDFFFSFRDPSVRELRSNSVDSVNLRSYSENINSGTNHEEEIDSNQHRTVIREAEKPRFQNGVLRTNCIDCLDRTNVAQYAYGLAALGRQLHAMGLTDLPKVDADSSIAVALMDMYQVMGDALAHQYGGSAAHNSVLL